MSFSKEVLKIDANTVIANITSAIKNQVVNVLHRRGSVHGLSGGVDSSVCAALCERALGKENVLSLFMPERDSSGDSLRLGKLVADSVGIKTLTEDITPILEGAGCYTRGIS
jgi:NAD+ synthase